MKREEVTDVIIQIVLLPLMLMAGLIGLMLIIYSASWMYNGIRTALFAPNGFDPGFSLIAKGISTTVAVWFCIKKSPQAITIIEDTIRKYREK